MERGVNAPSVAGLEKFAKVLRSRSKAFTFEETDEPGRHLYPAKGTLDGVASNLRAKGIHERHLHLEARARVTRKPTVPTDARSEFLANRAMGVGGAVAG